MDDEVAFLKGLVEIYGPHGHEEEVSRYLYENMKKLGFKTRRTPIGNVIGEVGEGEPVIFLCGHMDTVKGKLPVKIEDNKLYGRGAVDAKSPLAALILAASRFIGKPIKGKIIASGVVDEEGHSKGIRDLIKEGVKADYAIFGEPSLLKYITVGYKGSVSVHIDVKTQGGHSSIMSIDNAIEHAFTLWLKIKNAFQKYIKKSARASITSQITGISNEGVGNATIYLNFRYPKKEDYQTVKEELKNVTENYEAENPVKLTVIEDEMCPPYYSDKKSKLVDALRDAIKDVTGEDARLITKLGTGDMNIYGNSYPETQTVTYGPGDPSLDHTDDEVIDLDEYKKAIDIIEKCVETLLSNQDR